MKCCSNCFGDKFLKKEIEYQALGKGSCSFCGSENQKLVDPKVLSDKFELLISIYRPAEGGKTLIEWLREDWALFVHSNLNNGRIKNLLKEILDDEEIVEKTFIPSESCNTGSLKQWEDLRKELKHENRFFPKAKIAYESLKGHLEDLILDMNEVPKAWYRARIQPDGVSLNLGEMGAPPERIAAHGRANPAGIPYLYLGSTHKTAISEMRPHPGETACVATFELKSDLKIIDLREPRKLISPFGKDENEIAILRGNIEWLENLGVELTTPILPTAAAIDYIPSQYLCEYIKKCSYRGVIYNSSVSEGINLALFFPADAEAKTLKYYRISKVTVGIEEKVN